LNNRYPQYPDDADYQTNAPSYYEDLARKQHLIKKLSKRIWSYDETLANKLKDLNDLINDYSKKWDENLETINEDVIDMMIVWLEDGVVADIINNDVINRKAQIFTQVEEPSDKNNNVYWYKDVGNGGIGNN